ncbi:hypothetical protein VB711_23065 [Cronbergia sp. UHCC 0137]|uniref:hypothetical protein n=1 Tax=Cronbergia sp. UHCC 0137 TaxID=3110239 RepID=UPI002B213D2B|nr:hypothetical protein [Cronbergia sp. UHCC 0137]MEA5620697.1 hypothetical protein [Cronbergia sp. UHCC 0137]
MFATKKSYSKPSPCLNDFPPQGEIYLSTLTDARAEQIYGGTNTNPLDTDKNYQIIPSSETYQGVGLTPFYPDLPKTKLARLDPLDPSTRPEFTPKNAITITIPLPLPVYS